ncbi:hypothetical protein SBRCBS47491_009141 [Sporothrix bragantina]|uniref:Uncharacterized protein n=1 Tax=Sporothrix bragantina TaxID=671064 RepID=A0ABP0CSB3_9PEZI
MAGQDQSRKRKFCDGPGQGSEQRSESSSSQQTADNDNNESNGINDIDIDIDSSSSSTSISSSRSTRRPHRRNFYRLIIMDDAFVASWNRIQEVFTDMFVRNVPLWELGQEINGRSPHWSTFRNRHDLAAIRQNLFDWFTRIITLLAEFVLRGGAHRRMSELVEASIQRGHLELALRFQHHFPYTPDYVPPAPQPYYLPMVRRPLEFVKITAADIEEQMANLADLDTFLDGPGGRAEYDYPSDDDSSDDEDEISNLPGMATFDLNRPNDEDGDGDSEPTDSA